MLANELPWKIDFQHIKGHQDKGHPMVLSRKAWLNIKADLLAKACITPLYHGQIVYRLPYEPWHLEIASRRSTKHPKQDLRKAMNGPLARAYWQKNATPIAHTGRTQYRCDGKGDAGNTSPQTTDADGPQNKSLDSLPMGKTCSNMARGPRQNALGATQRQKTSNISYIAQTRVPGSNGWQTWKN